MQILIVYQIYPVHFLKIGEESVRSLTLLALFVHIKVVDSTWLDFGQAGLHVPNMVAGTIMGHCFH